MIPGINIDRSKGKVTKLGQEVALYIDGQKVGYREIQNINTKTIDRIEYIDVPSGKYVQDNAAINIITKKHEMGSYLALDAKQNIAYLQGSYNATAQFSRRNLTFHLFGGYDMEDYDNAGSMVSEKYTLENRTVERNSETSEERNKSNSQYMQFNLRSVTPKRTLSTKASFVHNLTPDNKTIKGVEYLNIEENDIASHSQTDEKKYKPAVELYGDFKLPHKQNLTMTLIGSYSKNEYSHIYEENEFTSSVFSDEDLYNAYLNVNYNKQINKNKNTLSAFFFDNYTHSNSNYRGSSNYDQKLYTNESMLYLGYLHNFNTKWILNALLGGSWLNYELEGEEAVSQLSPRTSLTLRYMPSQRQAITFIFSVANSFPSINTLNTVEQILNPVLVKRGNPDLEISKLYNTALMYNLFSKKVTLQAMLINNNYTDLVVPHYFTEGDKVVYTYSSDIDLHQYIGVLSGTYHIAKNLDFKTEFAMFYYQFNGVFEKKHTAYRAIVDLNYSWKNFMFNLSARAKEKHLSHTVFEEDFVSYKGNVRWSIPNWHIEVGISNPFSKSNYLKKSYDNPAYTYHSSIFSKPNQRNAYVKVIYKFSHGKKQNIENASMKRDVNSAIMKAQ